MKVKSILITGDDGYNSIGVRLLAHWLKDEYDVKIAATKNQQSGVGGCINIKGGSFGEALIEDVPALWVEGSPCDAVDAARAHYRQDFDLLLSGINLGANVGTSIISSGTFSAVVRGLGLGVAPHGLALSWNAHWDLWTKKHDESDPLDEFLQYPGKRAQQIIKLAMEHNFWGAKILNINFPQDESHEVRFAKFLPGINNFFLPVKLDHEKQQFYYPGGLVNYQAQEEQVDTNLLNEGCITISPCRADFLDNDLFSQLKSQQYNLE